MGKPKHKNRNKKKQKKWNGGPSQTIPDLLELAMAHLDRFEVHEAQGLLQKALTMDPDHIGALELSGSLCLDFGNLEGAKKCYGRAIELSGDNGDNGDNNTGTGDNVGDKAHEKYFAMGQLVNGFDSLNCYKKGIEILSKYIDRNTDITQKSDTETDIAQKSDKIADITQKSDKNMDRNMDIAQISDKNTDITQRTDKNTDIAQKTDKNTDITQKSDKITDKNTEEKENKLHGKATGPDITQKSDKIMDKNTEPEGNSSITSIYKELSSGYLAISELYMTDLCDEDDAEKICIDNINLAIKSDGQNAEALQTMASFQLIKGERDSAQIYMEKSLSIWIPLYENSDDLTHKTELNYGVRLNGAKILIELEMFDKAIFVLDGLMEEDDEVVNTWYLLGWTYYLQQDKEQAKYYLHKALAINENAPCEDEQLIEHINTLIEELGPLDDDDDEEIENADEVERELERESEEEDEDEEEMDTS